MAAVLLVVLLVEVGFGLAGGWITSQRGRGGTPGFLLGFFLGGIGLVVAALLPKSLEHQIREAAVVQHSLQVYANTGVLPLPSMGVGPGAARLPAAVAARPMPRLPMISWTNVLDAARDVEPSGEQPLTLAVSHLSRSERDLLRAWCFARDTSENATLIALFDQRLLRVRWIERQPSIHYGHGHNGVTVHLGNDDLGQVRMGIGGGGNSEY